MLENFENVESLDVSPWGQSMLDMCKSLDK